MKTATETMEAAQAAAQTEQDRRAAARRLAMQNAIRPTPEEDAAITAAALTDPDNPPLIGGEGTEFKPARRPRGRPAADTTKAPVTMRLDNDVLEAFKATGNGWQTRINAVLREHVKKNNMLINL